MEHMHPDDLYKLICQKIEHDKAFILKEEMMKHESDFNYFLNALGTWMVAKGEKLRKRYSLSVKTNSLGSLQESSRVFKA